MLRASRALRAAHQSGALYGVGALASATVAGGLLLAEQWEVSSRNSLQEELDLFAARELRKAHREADEKTTKLRDAAPLWSGVLTQADASLQGPSMLRGAKHGTAVECVLPADIRARASRMLT